MSRNGSLAEAGEEKKRTYRLWKVNDRCTVAREGPGVIVAKIKPTNYVAEFHVKLDDGRTVVCGGDKLELAPQEHRVCVVCAKDFTARHGQKKVTCGWNCSEKYNRAQTRARGRKK